MFGPHITISPSGTEARYMDKEEETEWETDRQARIQDVQETDKRALEDLVVVLRGKLAEASAEGLTEASARYQEQLDQARAELSAISK